MAASQATGMTHKLGGSSMKQERCAHWARLVVLSVMMGGMIGIVMGYSIEEELAVMLGTAITTVSLGAYALIEATYRCAAKADCHHQSRQVTC